MFLSMGFITTDKAAVAIGVLTAIPSREKPAESAVKRGVDGQAKTSSN
jgi:hypothetical protein